MRTGRYKLIAAPRPELFDLQDDPGEQHDVFAARQALGQRMLDRLRERERQFSPGAAAEAQPVEVDPDARARLAALGYVGSFVTTAPPDEARTGLADPKDKVGLFNTITRAREISKDDGAFDEVVAMLHDVVRQDPKVIDAWFMLGNVYVKAGRPQDAIPYFKHALALKPDDDMAVVNLANAYRELGRDDEALVGFQRFLELDPKNSQVRYSTAEILLDRGDLDGAERELREAIAIEPKLVAARNALGVVALKRGDVATAEREIRAAVAENPDVRLAHFNLALVAEQRGRPQDAIAEYRQEIDLHPQASYKAWFNLGKVYAALGDRSAQADAFRHAIESNPNFAEGHLYLAKLYLDLGQRFDEALALARKGIELGPDAEYAPLGHYVIADIYSRQGRRVEAEQEASKGRALEAAHTGRTRR
jgi:tetratricopeptide (TPR) repeat protein